MAIKKRLLDYIEQCGSQAAAARNIGYSPAVINQYLNNCYKGNSRKLEHRLTELFANLDAEKKLESIKASNGYVPTSISDGVYKTIRLCHLKGGIAVECGEAGIGKTMACKKYAEDYPNTAIYMSVNPCTATTAAFLKHLCRVLGLQTGCKDDMWYRITDRLRGERKVLIIDEAQHLPIKTIETVRAFFDCYPEIAVCMVGNEDTYINLHRNKAAFAQIINRTKLTNIRHTSHITAKDIELLFPALQGQDMEVKYMLNVARSLQGVRGAQNLFSNAVDNRDISYAGLQAMARSMDIKVSA